MLPWEEGVITAPILQMRLQESKSLAEVTDPVRSLPDDVFPSARSQPGGYEKQRETRLHLWL